MAFIEESHSVLERSGTQSGWFDQVMIAPNCLARQLVQA